MPQVTPSVVTSVRHELRELESTKPGISKGSLAATALAMARELDTLDNTASGMASCARVLESTMAELRLTARRHKPAAPTTPETKDRVADLSERRAARRAGT